MVFSLEFLLVDFLAPDDSEDVKKASEDAAVEFVGECACGLEEHFDVHATSGLDDLEFSVLKGGEAEFLRGVVLETGVGGFEA